jgi:uncharacterized protein
MTRTSLSPRCSRSSAARRCRLLTQEEPLPSSGRYYVTMADGVELAAFVSVPAGLGRPTAAGDPRVRRLQRRVRAVLLHPVPRRPRRLRIVHAGLRGTGCSAGRFQLYSDLSAEDGATLVEWIAAQPWSNGDVGMYGHSYSATMAVYTAAKQPPSLRAITIDGLMDDLYRDLVYPGGWRTPASRSCGSPRRGRCRSGRAAR